MISQIFDALEQSFIPGKVSRTLTYYFSLGEYRKSVSLTPESCVSVDGKVAGDADCVCKMSEEMFLRVWNEGYMPGMKDFLSGAIKSNNPDALRVFLGAFGKGR